MMVEYRHALLISLPVSSNCFVAARRFEPEPVSAGDYDHAVHRIILKPSLLSQFRAEKEPKLGPLQKKLPRRSRIGLRLLVLRGHPHL
jgi:hypothetical protein